MYSCMASATVLLYATASTTVRAPLTASPLAKMPGMLVRPTSSVSNRPRAVVFRSLVLSVIVVQGPWLMETITLSAG